MQATQAAYSFVETFNSVILFPTITLLSAVAIFIFLYGCFQYIALSADAGAREKGVKHITWGIIGLVVMLSAYTILKIVVGTFGLDGELEDAAQGRMVVPVEGGGDTFEGDDVDFLVGDDEE